MRQIRMRDFFFGVIIIAVLGFSLYVQQDVATPAIHENGTERPRASTSKKPVSAISSWGPSPFLIGVPVPPDKTALIVERKRRMRAGGYQTPDEYYEMDIKELSTKADLHDVSAMLQLGERYWTEWEALQYDIDSNVSDDPRAVSIAYFTLAARGGALMVAGTVADRLIETGNTVEAAAWHLVATDYAQPLRQGAAIAKLGLLTDEQYAQARIRAEQLSQTMGLPIRRK